MTPHHPVETLREPVAGGSERGDRALSVPAILSMCDELLGEVGRREHIFHWLRAPGADADEWLPVDAYYPRARLVIMCRSGSGPHDSIYRELIPAHRLGLMTLNPRALGPDRQAVRDAITARIFDLERMPHERSRRAPQPERRPEGPPAKHPDGRREKRPRSPDRSRERSPEWTPIKVEHTSVPRGFVQGLGVLAGLAFAALLIGELYLGVIRVAFQDGRLVLGLAIVLEALSRALGTIAAERAGQRGWACVCAIVGAPVVVWVALLRQPDRIEVEPAPLAGLLAVLAAVVAVVGILIGS
jgi:hypothetical protein